MIAKTWNELNLNKWQIALLIGAPVALGVGSYWYYSRCNTKGKVGRKANGKTTSKATNKADIKQKHEADGAFDKTDSNALKERGNKFFKAREYEKAIDCYNEAITHCPPGKSSQLAVLYQNRAACYEMLQKYDQIIADCSKAIELDKHYIKAITRRAKAYETLDRLQDALNDITAVCILEQFQNNESLLITDRILKKQSKMKAKDTVKMCLNRNPPRNFIRQYFSSFSRDPLIQNKSTPEDLNGLIHLTDDKTEVEKSLMKATILILKGDIEQAEKELNLILQKDCDANIKVNALIKLGTIKVQDISEVETFSEALKCFDEAISLDANNPDIYLHRAQLYLLSEKVEDARKDLEMCCQLDDSFPSAISQKFYVQFRCGVRYNDHFLISQALQGFEKATETFKNSSEVYSLYAQTLMESGDFEKADEFFKRAIEIDPIDGNLLVHRGILHIQWKNDAEATSKLLEEAIKVDPTCQFAYEMSGSIEVQKGDLVKGLHHFERALELAHTELDRAHLYSLRDAAEAQHKAIKMLGFEMPSVQT